MRVLQNFLSICLILCISTFTTGCAHLTKGTSLPSGIVFLKDKLPEKSGDEIAQVGHAEEVEVVEAILEVPRELQMTSHPQYRVAPPDILLIEAVNNIRSPGGTLRSGDQVQVQIARGLPIEPEVDPENAPLEYQTAVAFETAFKVINGDYLIYPNGEIDLGPYYGRVKISGLNVDQATEAITQHLKQPTIGLKAPLVSLTMPVIAGKQQISGEHLVRPDGSVSMGIYGSVHVAGLSLNEVKYTIEAHLEQYLTDPEVNVDVLAYNSQVYYVITDGGGFGEQVQRFPCTGNETVLDAVAQIQGLSQVSSRNIWIARPAPAEMCTPQILPVDWRSIAAGGQTATNYQVLPGDRIYIQADRLIRFDNALSKLLAPVERIMGVTLLGSNTVQSLEGRNIGGGF